jgi:hypothetical protein
MKTAKRWVIMMSVSTMLLSSISSALGEMKAKQLNKAAIVFMVAGQSNAGGCGVYSPEMHKELGRDTKRPLIPGTTAAEVGLSTDAADYTHSYIWIQDTGFERLDPMVNTRPDKRGIKMHGMELPVVNQLENRFPDNDIYVIKHGPSGRTLYHDWNPDRDNGHYARWLGWYTSAIEQLSTEYPEVRVVGLYWDQGESDGSHADQYANNLTNLIATFRADSGLPELKVFIRKHIFHGGSMDVIIAAQEAVVGKDKHCFMLDIDRGTNEKNFETWSYSPNNIHLNSKAFVELARILSQDVLKNPNIESFDLYQPKKK